MATPSEKLAEALESLHSLQQQGFVAIKSTELNRVHRERLVRNGFISEVTKGWYVPSPPDEKTGDSTSWYSSYWEFCTRFIKEKYADNWIVSPEQSVLLHAANWSVPQQLIIRSPQGSNHITNLPYQTSLFSMKADLVSAEWTEVQHGIRMYSLPASLIYCSANTFTQHPIDVRTALAMIRDASEFLVVLLAEGHTSYAGRVSGALRNIGRGEIADEIVSTMKSMGYDVRETDPFKEQLNISLSVRERSPYINRLHLMWYQMREAVIQNFPSAPGIPGNLEDYMKTIDEVYVTDAYHSLSIERYRVSPELIERVRDGQWDFYNNKEDKQQRDAMAARGYWQAFLQVKESIQKVIAGGNAGELADSDHRRWYRELFAPSVTAGILKPADLAGYRNHQVYIGGSKHVPLNVDAVRDAMPILFELLKSEPEASVRAVLGHFIFVFIHPYMDGNGRMGRFLMNMMLASGGYPWTVIPVQERTIYMQALESASIKQDIEPFARFLGHLVNESLHGAPVAKIITS